MIVEFAVQCIVSFVATVAFSLLFHAPKNQYVWCGITGMAGWAVYWLLMQVENPSPVTASFAGAVVLALLTRIFSVARRTPYAVYITAGIFPLVPGAGIYYTVYYFIMAMNQEASAKGIETLKIAVAIALGIVLVLALPGKLFHLVLRGERAKRPNSNG